MESEWYVTRNDKEMGPISSAQLRNLATTGKLQPNDLVRRLDWTSPKPASAIKGLFAAQEPPMAKLAAVPPPAPVQHDLPPETPKQSKSIQSIWEGMSRGKKIGLGIGAGSLAMILMCCGGVGLMGKKTDRGESSAKWTIEVDAEELFGDYKSNEVAADNKYKGKTLLVTGTVDKIAKGLGDGIYVTLRGDRGRFSIGNVQCMFGDKNGTVTEEFRKGQGVMLSGRCKGKFGNVILQDCKFQGYAGR
jgi:hypothetical protein